MDRRELRLEVLLRRTSSLNVAAELLEYNQPLPPLENAVRLPLVSEPHLDAWEQYAAEAQKCGIFETLRSKLVQLQFPISAGISQTPAYHAATRRGDAPSLFPEATGLCLDHPEALQLRLYPTLAGALPVLITGCRQDFVMLVQALTKRNEPEHIPNSMGSCLVSGYINWDRVAALHRHWETTGAGLSWAEEFQQFIGPHKQLYQDRFLILSSDPYSQVPAEALALTDDDWCGISTTIRLEHEATHYLIYRLYGQIRTNILDELWADYRGIAAVLGHYRADWGLRFLGLHDYPAYYPGSRLENYRRSLSDEAFCVLQSLVRDAADNLERIEHHFLDQRSSADASSRLLLALIQQSLEELASDHALSAIQQALIPV